VFACAVVLIAFAARAQDPDAPFQVDADEVEYQADRDLYVARGNVVLTQEGRKLEADSVIFSNRTKQGVASGDVVVTDGDDVLRAPFLQFNVDLEQGVVLDGELDSPKGGYRMQGREVRKVGDQTYEFVDGRFTTCRCPEKHDRDPWALKAKEAELDIDGYGRARNSTLEVLGVPVLYLPYAVYPLKRERQTGFMFPQVGTSTRTGGDIALPFFWAARHNVNVTLESQYQLKRGFKPSALVEYVYGETAEGELYGTFIHDEEVESNSDATPFGDERWGARWQHQERFPYSTWATAHVVQLSDNQFPFDFADFRQYRRDRFLQSSAQVTTHFGSETGRFASALWVNSTDDLQNPDDQDRDDYILQRLPTLDVMALPKPIAAVPNLLVSSGVEFVNFQPYGGQANRYESSLRIDDRFYDTGFDAVQDGQERNNVGVKTPFDEHRDTNADVRGGPERDGEFQEGEPLADRGQRLLANPRVAYPFQLGDVVEVYPEAGYSGTFYDANRQGLDHRSLFTGRLDLRTRFRGEVSLPGAGKLTHVAAPFLQWVGISNADQDDNPLFVPTTAVPQNRLRLLELDNWTLDPADRIDDASNVVAGVQNRFWQPGGWMYTELTGLVEYQGLESEFGSAVLQGRTSLPYGVWTRFHGVVDLSGGEFADGLFDVGWDRSGHRIAIGYRYVRDIPRVFENFLRNDRFEDFLDNFSRINQITGSLRWQATRSWAVTYAGNYSFDNAVSLINQFGVEYFSKCYCWAVRFEVSQDRTRGVDWTLQYRLVGLGEPPDRLFPR
jgi:lipopolysaccharide assembly outer membrane protein LptD (OstA)